MKDQPGSRKFKIVFYFESALNITLSYDTGGERDEAFQKICDADWNDKLIVPGYNNGVKKALINLSRVYMVSCTDE